MFGQNELRWVVVSRARLPITGHQENPAARLNSMAIIKSRVRSPNGSMGLAERSSPHDLSEKIRTSMTSVTIARPGATIRFSHFIETGPFTRTSHEIAMARRAMPTTKAPFGTAFVPKAALATLEVALPNMIAKTAAQPISIRATKPNTIRRVPFFPKTLLRDVYCSRPYLAEGTQVASALRGTEITFPMIIAAIPAFAPTNRAVEQIGR